MSRSWTRLLLPGLLLIVAVYWVTRGNHRPPAAAAAASASANVDSLPLLEGLKPGDSVGEWTVGRILVNESNEKKPQLAIELERKGSGITIWVARKENVSNPPLLTARYALSFGHARPYGEAIPGNAYNVCMQLIAERIRRTETTAPVPPGL